MRGPIRAVVLAALAAFAFAAVTAGVASAAILGQPANTPFLAIYGNPGSNGATLPVGGGLGRNFGFGENMLFESTKAKFEIGKVKAESKEAFVGSTLMSNKTGVNNPVSVTVQFADFQDSEVIGVGLVPTYADTSDRPWITEICPIETGTLCRVDPEIKPNNLGEVKIEDVSLNLGPGFVVQGTVWGTFKNGTETECASISLNLPPKEITEKSPDETLWVTQTKEGFPAVGEKLEAIEGKFCLISANNDWYTGHHTAITLNNKG